MRTTLRGRAFLADQDRDARDPSAYAGACVELLSPAGSPYRGRILVAADAASPVRAAPRP
jgi:hypothetical protein